MKMKHWAYIGMALIDVNASLLGHVRAAELTQNPLVYQQPSAFAYLRYRYETALHKPQKLSAPVTVRLFSSQHLSAIWLKNTTGFVFSGRVVQSPVLVAVKNGQLQVYHEEQMEVAAKSFHVDSMDDRVYELRTKTGASHRATRGEISLMLVKGKIQIVNKLNLEDYVSGILEGELGTLDLSPEALKAQLVVARTYVLSMRGDRHHGEGYEFCDNPHCQVFSGIPHEGHAALEAALPAVRGQYLTYHGQPIAAFYHHDCGGMTDAVEEVWPTKAAPYLVPVSEGADSVCRLSPKYAWRFVESRRSLAACFRHVGWLHPQEALDTVKVAHVDSSGRVRIIMIQGNRTLIVPVGKLRNVVNQYYGREVLRSAMFTLTRDGDRFVFKGRGWGHGVGLCQEGAKSMARNGKTYKEILEHYFPHTKLAKLR